MLPLAISIDYIIIYLVITHLSFYIFSQDVTFVTHSLCNVDNLDKCLVVLALHCSDLKLHKLENHIVSVMLVAKRTPI